MRQYLASASVALAAASVIAATPVTPKPAPPPPIHVVSADVRLAAASSILNIPINLVQDIINIPYNEVQGINLAGESLLFTGTWLIASNTNIWGVDPGDVARNYGLFNALIPFPSIANPLAAQVSGLMEVLLPIHSGCNTITCPNPGALIAGWFQPARILTLLTTGKYTFNDTPVTYPDGTTHPPEGLWSFGGPVTWGAQYGHPEWNTTTNPADGQPQVPWAGTTFTLDPLSPFTSYLTHLMSDPTSPGNTIKFPTLQQIGTAFTNLAEGLFVDFSPIFPGSPYCLGLCGPTSALGPPFFHGTNPFAPSSGLASTITSLSQHSAPLGAKAAAPLGANAAVVNPSKAKPVKEQSALQTVPQTAAPQAGQGLGTAQTANDTPTQSAITSTDVTNGGKGGSSQNGKDTNTPPARVVGGLDSLRDRLRPNPSKSTDGSNNGAGKSGNSVHAGKK